MALPDRSLSREVTELQALAVEATKQGARPRPVTRDL